MKTHLSDRDPIVSQVPHVGLPSPAELRFLLALLREGASVDDVAALVRAKDYTGAHELAGYLNCLDDIEAVAYELENPLTEQSPREAP